MRVLSILLLTLSVPAAAYETDQLTRRDEPLKDARPLANAHAMVLLQSAAEHTNLMTHCKQSDERTRRVLATEINRVFSEPKYVANRGEFLDGLGFGAYPAWLEESEADRRAFRDRSDIYRDVRPADSLVIAAVGVCSTINLAGVLIGTDKVDHFWAQGYEYERQSHWGKRPELAVKWGTASERGQYGLLTSKVFSFADLHANWLGFQFYEDLLTRDSVLQRIKDGPEEGCVALSGTFDWRDWVDDGLDEVYNPPYLSERVDAAVHERVDAERGQICASFAKWGDDYQTRRDRVMHEVYYEYTADAPKRLDTLDLDELCTPVSRQQAAGE